VFLSEIGETEAAMADLAVIRRHDIVPPGAEKLFEALSAGATAAE